MGLELKSRRSKRCEIPRASLDFEHLCALPAAKVMMVCSPGTLITRRFARQLHGHKPPIVHERVDGTVDGGDSQPRDLRAPSLEHLERAERPGRVFENLTDGIALPRLAFHDPNMTGSPVACRPRSRFDFASMPPSTDSALGKLRSRHQWLVFVAVAVTSIIVAHLLDHAVWQHVRDPRVNDRDWGRLLRSMGYLPTWIVVAGALWLQDSGSARRSADPSTRWGRRGGLMVLAPAVAGALGEVLKMLFRRQRPSPDVFGYQWRPFSEDLISTKGLGLPSSHAIVAFAAAAVLARLFPRAWWLWYLLASGCVMTRLLSLGHFFSDTVVAAFLGYAVGVVMARSGGFGKSLQARARTVDA